MKELGKTMVEIYEKHRGVLLWMAALLLIALAFFVHGMINLAPQSVMVKTGYGDIGRYQGGEWSEMQAAGGYRDGSWEQMLAFPIMAIVLGIIHCFIAIKLYRNKGAAMAGAFLFASILLIIVAWVVMVRLS